MEGRRMFFLESRNHSIVESQLDIDPLPFRYTEEEFPPFGELLFGDYKDKSRLDNSSLILSKINKFEDTYYNNLKSFPNTDAKLHDKSILEKNLNLIENTLPGFIICLLFKQGNAPLPEDLIFEFVLQNYNNLRKPNGSKYKGNINKVFKSTLGSSGLFSKASDGKWFYNEKEAVEYVLRVTEKLLTKKIEKEGKNEEVLDETRTTNTADKKAAVSKKKAKLKKKLKSADEVNYKILKVYNILDDLLNKYKKDKEIGKILRNPFKSINSSIELLQKIGNDNKCVGILMCFKFFRTIINKFIKIISRKKDEEHGQAEAINNKIEVLNKKIEYIEKYFFAEKKPFKNESRNEGPLTPDQPKEN